jgi:hypothetical protein
MSKYDETHLVAIETVCDNTLRVVNSIREAKKERDLILSKKSKLVRIAIGNSEQNLSYEETLKLLDTLIENNESTLGMLMRSFDYIEKKRREGSILIAERTCGVVFKTDDKPTGTIIY